MSSAIACIWWTHLETQGPTDVYFQKFYHLFSKIYNCACSFCWPIRFCKDIIYKVIHVYHKKLVQELFALDVRALMAVYFPKVLILFLPNRSPNYCLISDTVLLLQCFLDNPVCIGILRAYSTDNTSTVTWATLVG